jgi:2-iminobutanoate/2-iminopropanoate deaminase
MITGDFENEVRQVCINITSILEASGLTWRDIVKIGIFTTDLTQFKQINSVYSEFTSSPYPARAAVEVAALPKGARIEMEAIAYVK